jgi:hypothetical protein
MNPAADPASLAPSEPPMHPVTPAMVLALGQTRPWVLFLAIVGFIGAGLMIVGGLGVAAVMGFAGALAGSAGGELGGMGAAMGLGLGALYLAFGVLYLFPSLFLWRYAAGIRAMLGADPVGGMESALRAQKSFWKFVGIAFIALLGFYALLVLAFLLIAGASAFSGMAGI